MARASTPRRHTTVSPDGTPIASWSRGTGPPLLLVHGAMSDHRRWRIPSLLEPRHTVHTMDRRGRGHSGDAPGWSLDREVEDVVAVLEAIALESGSAVDLLGHSLGGTLALRAAVQTHTVRRLVLYEPGVNERAQPAELVERLQRLLDEDRREEAVELALREVVLMPEEEVAFLRAQPSWPTRVAAAHTLPRELGVDLVIDPDEISRVGVPTLVLLGGDSPEPVQEASRILTGALPRCRLVVIEGQQHVADQVVPEAFAGHVRDFLEADLS